MDENTNVEEFKLSANAYISQIFILPDKAIYDPE